MKKDFILEVLILAIGCMLIAFGIEVFFNPNSIAPGGLTGLAIVINKVFNIPLWIINIGLNIPLFLIAYKILSRKECIKTILGIILLSISLGIVALLPTIYISNDILLVCLFGGILLGIGTGLIIRINGTTGGTDLIGVIVNRISPNLKAPTVMGCCDAIVVLLSVLITGSIEIGLYSALTVFIVAYVSNLIVEGVNISSSFIIITNKPHEISQVINTELMRGVTMVKCVGFYTNEEKYVVYSVVSKKQIVKLKKIIKQIDPKAFIVVSNNSETIGEGFRNIYVS